jgi:hypothetical protein
VDGFPTTSGKKDNQKGYNAGNRGVLQWNTGSRRKGKTVEILLISPVNADNHSGYFHHDPESLFTFLSQPSGFPFTLHQDEDIVFLDWSLQRQPGQLLEIRTLTFRMIERD